MVRESSHCPEHRGDMREVSVCAVDWIVLRAMVADGARRGGLGTDGLAAVKMVNIR